MQRGSLVVCILIASDAFTRSLLETIYFDDKVDPDSYDFRVGLPSLFLLIGAAFDLAYYLAH